MNSSLYARLTLIIGPPTRKGSAMSRAFSPEPPPATIRRPWTIRVVLVLSAVLVTLLVIRNLVQAAAIESYLTATGSAGAAADITASSAGWIVDTSFVIATAWVAVALYAFSGSQLGRAIFTVLLAGSTAVGLASAVAPQVLTMGPGEGILAAAHPAFTPVMSLAVALVSIAVLILLYRPDSAEFYRAHSPRGAAPQQEGGHIEVVAEILPTDVPADQSANRVAALDEAKAPAPTTTPPLPAAGPRLKAPVAPGL